MFGLARKRVEFRKIKKPSKVLDVVNKKKQTNPDVAYVILPHSRKNMTERHITESDVVKSIEEFDKHYEKDDKTVVEKKIGDHVVRIVYSYNMYTNQISVITAMYINKRQFATKRTDQL